MVDIIHYTWTVNDKNFLKKTVTHCRNSHINRHNNNRHVRHMSTGEAWFKIKPGDDIPRMAELRAAQTGSL